MKKTTLLFLFSFAAVGCSNTARQSSPETALDHVTVAEESELTEYHSREQSEVSETMVSSVTSPSESETGSGTQSASQGTLQLADAATAEGLIGDSWSSAENERVYLAARELGGFSEDEVVPMAHFRRGNRNVVVFWPALSATGELTSSAVYGVCVEAYEDGSFDSCGPMWNIVEVTSAAAELESALGGSDYEVVDEQSTAELAQLGDQLVEHGNDFVRAAASGDRDSLFRSAQEFVRMLPVEDVAFDNTIAYLLVNAARSGKAFRSMKTETGDLLASITFNVSENVQGAEAYNLIAQQSQGDQWRIVDYW